VTRDRAEPDLRPPLERLAGAFAGRLAAVAPFFALFFNAGPRDDFFAAFFIELLRAGPRLAPALLAAAFLAGLAPPRVFAPPRFFPVLPPDFVRDFLARVAMMLLLGVGGEVQHGG
jgi:hypothetical protein